MELFYVHLAKFCSVPLGECCIFFLFLPLSLNNFSILITLLFISAIQEWLSHYPHLHRNGPIGLNRIIGIICNWLIWCTAEKGALSGGHFAKVIDECYIFYSFIYLKAKFCQLLDLLLSCLFTYEFDRMSMSEHFYLNLLIYYENREAFSFYTILFIHLVRKKN